MACFHAIRASVARELALPRTMEERLGGGWEGGSFGGPVDDGDEPDAAPAQPVAVAAGGSAPPAGDLFDLPECVCPKCRDMPRCA